MEPVAGTSGSKRPEEDNAFINHLRKQGIALESLTAEELDALYTDYAGERALLGDQQMQAQLLRETPLPEGRSTGGIYAASNPLESLGALGSQAVGSVRNRQVQDAQKALNEKYKTGAAGYGKALASAVAGTPAGGPTTAPRPTMQATPTQGTTNGPAAGSAPPVQSQPTQTPPQVPAAGQQQPQIFRPGPMQSGMTPTRENPAWMAAAIRGMGGLPQTDPNLMSEQQRIAAERKREEQKRKEEIQRKTGFLSSFGGI